MGPEVGVQLPSEPLVAYWMLVKPMDQLYTVAGEQLVTGFRNSPEQSRAGGAPVCGYYVLHCGIQDS